MTLALFGEGLLQAQSGTNAGVIPTAAPIQARQRPLEISGELAANETDHCIWEAGT